MPAVFTAKTARTPGRGKPPQPSPDDPILCRASSSQQVPDTCFPDLAKLVTVSSPLAGSPAIPPTVSGGRPLLDHPNGNPPMSSTRSCYRWMFAGKALFVVSLSVGGLFVGGHVIAEDPATDVRFARIDGTEPGFRALTEDDFVVVNGEETTWSFVDGEIHTTGKPIGVMRTKQKFTNFELVVRWRHLESGGNSGIFAWVTDEGLEGLQPNQLPKTGIELQMLDHGYYDKYLADSGRAADWFSTHGDVFAVGKSRMKPFPPTSPNGSRSFPSEERSLGVNQWNHYYVRGVNGEIRLWVNGVEVSGGSDCDPRSGYFCLEAEGAPVEFKGLRVRELP